MRLPKIMIISGLFIELFFVLMVLLVVIMIGVLVDTANKIKKSLKG